MKKQELITGIVEALKEKEVKASQVLVKEVLVALEEVVDATILAGDEVVVCGTKFASKEVDAKEGVINFGDKQGEKWTTPAMVIPTAKILKSKKDALSREI